MISESSFSSVFGAAIPGGEDSLVHLARAAVAAGFAVVPNRPGSKKPMCTLNALEQKRADVAAKEEARIAGHRKPDAVRHTCGVHHAITETKDSDRIFKRLIKNGERPNIGIELGRSRRLVVDVDTVEELAGFKASWAAATADPMPPITVESPGVYADETWKHKGGGHYWFTLPDGWVLPASDGAMKDESGWIAMWANRQVLVPPSVREEGPYKLVDTETPAPKWLLQRVVSHIKDRRDRAAEQEHRRAERQATGELASVDVWSTVTSWADILTPEGWEATGLPDTCGCEIWTAPGVHASPKSATTHDIGCTIYDFSTGHAPIHIWTDNPPDYLMQFGKTFTKLQFVALRDHGGMGAQSIAEASRAQGISREGGMGTVLQPLAEAVIDAAVPDPVFTRPETTPQLGNFTPLGPIADPTPAGTGGDQLPAADDAPRKVWYSADQFDQVPQPEPLIAGILVAGSYARIVGKSNHGKSFLGIDLAGHIATGRPWAGHEVKQGTVAYIAAEDATGVMARVRAWEHRHGVKLGEGFWLRIEAVQVIDDLGWAQLIADMVTLAPSTIFIDTQAASTYGLKENEAEDAGELNGRMAQLIARTKATVILIHHMGHEGTRGRGSSALIGALDTEITIKKDEESATALGMPTEVTIACSKQRNWQQFPDIAARITSEAMGSAALSVVDPLTVGIDEPKKNTFDQQTENLHLVARFIHEQGNGLGGVTRAEIAKGVKLRGKPMHPTTLSRVMKTLIEDGRLKDVNGALVAAEGDGMKGGETFVQYSPSLRVVLAEGMVHELGLGS